MSRSRTTKGQNSERNNVSRPAMRRSSHRPADCR